MRPTMFIALIGMMTSVVIQASAQKTYSGSASGTLTLDDKPVSLRYAYVVEVDNIEERGLMQDGPQKYLVIVLSDRSLPHASVANRYAPVGELRSPAQAFEPLQESAANKMTGILLKVDPVKQTAFQAQFFYPGKSDLFRIVGADVPDRIARLTRRNGSLSGTAFLATAQNTGFKSGPKQYRYHVSFRAPILSEPAVKATLEGKAALESAP